MEIFSEAQVEMSSIYRCHQGYCFEGSKAVDGIYEPGPESELSNLAHTDDEPNPWIQINLDQAYCIIAVKVWNRVIADLPGILVIKAFNTIFGFSFGSNSKAANLNKKTTKIDHKI